MARVCQSYTHLLQLWESVRTKVVTSLNTSDDDILITTLTAMLARAKVLISLEDKRQTSYCQGVIHTSLADLQPENHLRLY